MCETVVKVIFLLILFLQGISPHLTNNQNGTDDCDSEAPSQSSSRHWKRYADPTFRGSPKTREQMWHQNFNMDTETFDQTASMITLLNKIIVSYFDQCIPVILYDTYVQNSDLIILQKLFQTMPYTFIHGQINKDYTIGDKTLINPGGAKCRSFILFLSDVMKTRDVLGPQTRNRVVVVPRSTQWKLQDFLSASISRDIVNLLVIGESYVADVSKERPYVLYTHKLYTDGLGTNKPVVLTSWLNNRLTRPHVHLFPPKFKKGFSGHRFLVAAANQPPFVFKMKSTDGVGNVNIRWDGVEIRMLRIMQNFLNFTFEIQESTDQTLSSGDQVVHEVFTGRGDIGIAGSYITTDRTELVEMSVGHSRDCAAFLTLTSKALPRYRAIMGPFQYPVWIALTFTYLVAIFPLAFSDKLTLRHLIGNYGEVENMFWYVFGTFTNCFTFVGTNSWSQSKRNSTRMLIGWYWVFTIIITSCYTGSIIAFVTLPVFPSTVNTIEQLLGGFYRVGTFGFGGWEHWFDNSSHALTTKLMKNIEYVANLEEGINNVTKAFFWSYAFLGSRAEIQYVVQTNYTDEKISKRSALHISDRCFGLFYTGLAMPHDSVYSESLNEMILMMQQSGLMEKLSNEVAWQMQRSSSGRLLETSHGNVLRPEERGLTLADTEGMFLLLGIGFLLATAALVSEWVGGCSKKCRSIIVKRRDDRRRAELHIDENSNPISEESSRTASGVSTTNNSSNPIKKGHRRKSSTFFRRLKEPEVDYEEPEMKDIQEVEKPKSQKSADSRKTSVSLNIFNRETLKDMYSGDRKRRHSNVIIINGELITESQALNHLKHQHEQEDIRRSRELTHQAEVNNWNKEDNQKVVDDLFGEEVKF